MTKFHLALIASFGLITSLPIFSQTSMPLPSGTRQTMNPDTSINTLTLYRHAKRQGESKTEAGSGFFLQEVELQFMAAVDPYLRASALLSIHPQGEHEGSEEAPDPGHAAETGFAMEPEEVFVETTSLPYLTLKAGRFHAALGRHNGLHAHTFPFLDAPLVNQRLLGDEGLIEVGLSAAVLLPVPWFMELNAQGLNGDSPTLFASPSSSDLASVYRWRNLFDLSSELTLDLGISAARGRNAYQDYSTSSGADLTFKWRPVKGGKYTAFILTTEYLQGEVKGRPENSKLAGFATWLQYQFAARWWVQGRGEHLQVEGQGSEKKYSALIAFFPSEFSGFRLQYDQLRVAGADPLNTIAFQTNYTIGAHPAHTY